MEKTKPTPMRVLRAFRWQRAFERLMQEREGMTTLKEMAGLINDIARIESDVFRPVTEEELKALEDDPMHGMSDVAMMYVFFMRATSTIHRSDRNLGDFNDEEWKIIREKVGVANSDDFAKKMGVLNDYDDGECLLTGLTIGFTGADGVKKWVSLSGAAIDDEDVNELVEMVRASLKSWIWKKARKKGAYRKRRKMFREVVSEKTQVRMLRDMLLGKSEDD